MAMIQINLQNGRISLVQSFTARMPLLRASSAFGLGRRRWSFVNSVIYTVSLPWNRQKKTKL